jgi:Cytochrome P450
MSTRIDSLRDLSLWKSFAGFLDDKARTLPGELSMSRVVPSGLEPPQTPSTVTGTDPWARTAVVITGVASTLLLGLTVKSLVGMALWRRRLRDAESNEPARGPHPLPVIGNILELRTSYYETLYRYIESPAAVFWVLSTPFVVVTDEESVRKVLGGAGGRYQKPKYFGYRSKVVQAAVEKEQAKVMAENVDYSDGGDASRRGLKALVESSFCTITSSMDRLLNVLADESDKLEIEDRQLKSLSSVRQALVELNLDILFGLGAKDSESRRVSDMIGSAGAEFARRMVNPLRVLVDLPANFRYIRDVGGLIGLGRKLCAKLDEAVVNARNDAENGSNGPEKKGPTPQSAGLNWVHAWVGKVGKVGKLGKVVGLLMASSQTVPVTAVWMLHLTAKHPSERERMKRELADLGVHSGCDLQYAHLDQMPLVDAVVRETLRLYPPFPLIQRQAQVDDVLGGITVPTGTHVFVVPWLVHRNPKLWPAPHEFRPDRFISGDPFHGDAPSDWAYIPFGRGPRMCAGSHLALAELKVLLCFALLDFEWTSSCTSGEDGIFPELGMVPKGIRLFVKRCQQDGST